MRFAIFMVLLGACDAEIPGSIAPDASVPAQPDGAASPDAAAPDAGAAAGWSCLPPASATSNGGGRCADLNQAWTARGINVGYYAYRVKAPLEQYSGDFSGTPGTIFQAGGGSRGVILQIIPAGAYVGLATTGPWYDPAASDCAVSCGSSASACRDSSPPLRPQIGGFAWGYAYQGASHLQGWIPFDPARLEFAGFDPAHPCALGPAGADFEAASCGGQATACSGGNRTCGAANHCDEGSDDCGATACGAQSGGPLTPSAHRMALRKPPSAVACTTRTPPHPSVECLPNGGATDFFFVYPFGAYLYWAQNSTTKHWLHYGDVVQVYFHNRDAQGVLWDFVEVLQSGAPTLTPPSDGTGAGGGCSATSPQSCTPCRNGGACGWIQEVFLAPQ